MPDTPELPPIAQAPLSVVLPAHNAEAVVEDVLLAWAEFLASLSRDYEILLVDDGSSDKTRRLAEEAAEGLPQVRALAHSTRQGIGAALRTGLAAAKHPLLCYAACSPAYQPADLKAMLEAIDQVHLVAGVRQGRRRGADMGYRLVLRLAFGLRLLDPECCFKLFRRSVFARIPIQSNGEFAHAEILAKANFLGCMMTELPVSYRPPPSGEGVTDRVGWRHKLSEARLVFAHPDFGPAVVAEGP